MNKRALLGFYTLIALGALFGLFALLGDYGTKVNGYRFGIRFPSAAGLNPGALVFESGVVVGSVDSVTVLPNYSTEVVVALHAKTNIPRDSRFLILQPLTGDPTLRIYPLQTEGSAIPPAYPHEILPIAEQPIGVATVSIAEFLANSQSQFTKVDALLDQFQTNGPELFRNLNATLANANKLMITANGSMETLTSDAHRSLGSLNESSETLTAELSRSLAIASAELLDVTARLDESSKRGQPHLDHLMAELDHASHSLALSVDSLHAIAGDPALHANVVRSVKSLADTTQTFAALLNDFRQVTGNEATQAELRDAVAHIDAASQRADSMFGRFGGRSNVPGVDVPLGVVTPVPLPGAPAAAPNSTPATPPAKVGQINLPTAAPLLGVTVRMSELSPLHQSAQGTPLVSPLLTADRGPQTDLGLTLFPDAATSYYVGANDIGAVTTVSLEQMHKAGAVRYGGGILYSRLGVATGLQAGPLGLDASFYDPRRGTLDLTGGVKLGDHATVYGGQRDATRVSRRNVYGMEFHF